MSGHLAFLTVLIFALFAFPAHGYNGLCDYAKEWCDSPGGHSSTAPAYPSQSSSFNLNPSAVPVEEVLGIQTLEFKNQWDVSIVKGTGRVGAAIAPTNNEETFFGAPAFELPEIYLQRRLAQQKYASQKINLATAFSIINNGRDEMGRIHVNLGVIGKYNRQTGSVWPGAGLSGVYGPFTFGYAIGQDETVIDYNPLGINLVQNYRYSTETYSAGLFLSSLALDYSHLTIYTPDNNNSTIILLTGSVFLQRWIFSIAYRTEDSLRPAFDIATQSLVGQEYKYETFGGVQFALTKAFMVGLFYNYYLLHEGSLGLTLFL